MLTIETTPAESTDIIRQICEDTALHGGCTYNPCANKFVNQHDPVYGVCCFPDRSKTVKPWQLTPELVADFVRRNWDLLQSPDNCIGTWLDTSDPRGAKIWLDVSSCFTDRSFASFAGMVCNQKSVWDFQRQSEIPTHGTGEVLRHMRLAPAKSRIDDIRQQFTNSNN